MKYLLFIVTVTFSFIANAGYTTMTLEGVKEANGVWTAAGVADSMGFVRTTGALTVAGQTVSTSVAIKASQTAASTLLKNTARSLGPYGLAAYGAYEVYDYFTTDNKIVACDAEPSSGWCRAADMTGYDYTYSYGYYWAVTDGGPLIIESSLSDACTSLANSRGKAVGSISGTVCYIVDKVTGARFNSATAAKNPCTSATKSVTSCNSTTDPKLPQRKPMTDADWAKLSLFDWPTLNDGFQKIPTLRDGGLPLESTSFKPFSDWLGQPYFKDGNWFRDRMDISPCPTSSQPTRVCVDIGPVKLDGQTDPNVVPDTSGGGSAQPKEKPSFCEANPMSIACAEMGTLKDEKLETTELPVNVSYTPWGSSTAQCPSPRVIPLWEGKSISMSYAPVCDFVSMLRPLLIALAFVTAAFILGGFGRSGGGE